MGTHPAEGPLGRQGIGTQGLQLLGILVGHLGQRTATQGLHHHDLDSRFLEFIVKVLGIGVLLPALLVERGMAPIEEIHLNLHEVPVILVVIVDKPVKHAHVAVIRKAQMAYAALLALADEEIEQTVVDETAVQVVQSTLPHAVHQIIVDVIHP